MTNDDSWGGFPPPTAKPVYEIPVTPPGATAAGWTPGPGAPLSPPPTWSAAAAAPAAAPAPPPPAPVAEGADLPVVPAGPPPAAQAPVWDLADHAPTSRLVPGGRRAAQQAEAANGQGAGRETRTFDEDTSTLTATEREALEKADPELVAALREVVLQRASDLHVTVGAPPMVRIDGALTPAGPAAPWGTERTMSALMSLLTERQKEMFKRELELDFAFTISANSRFRVNLYQQRGSIGAAFRLIPTEIKQLRELGVPEQIGRFASLPRGLVLVTGPTGSGKSTTLAALIDLVNSTRADHIVTVEDPIEFMHTHKKSIVNQREVGHDTHSFNNALKHVLRQDPDVILIGELRDLETISVALTAAETGHLVFATLHTQDAPQTIDRVIDVFPPHQQGQVRAQLAGTLQGVVCQTLVKRASGRGRVVATEVLMMTPAIANLIREGKTYQIASAMQAGAGDGMHTMDQHLADLVDSGAITRTAALEKAHDLESIGRLIQRADSSTDASAQAFAASEPDFGDSFSGQVR
ncbi:type IV pilus twitching motility protein PilT [Leifsonia sp. 21MFCrub1.1]|uniref:type IV pilus twitching motility protein PilT n=1 Tax=Leifsonia sp. 21MFCrub1.1 TaxID=1798223 RepID=UPI000892A46D|nr:type IV pilus twitching motility protein PilT [Leifsonia sp. 21MFCrub1.1]SEA55064.1 twitching motility protein PilT [Leifsonia sp. 21MFCrub1.1]